MTDSSTSTPAPAAVRPGLPENGFVNYLEAQAIVRVLENLAGEARSAELGPIARA